MKAVTLHAKAPAKINLGLDIVGKRDDGYHDLRTIMASVSLYDTLTITLTPCETGEETFTASAEGVEGDNLAARAARLFMQRNDLTGWRVHIHIDKRIPISAGLGGGSSDAAAVLRILHEWRPMAQNALAGLALELGSDVPYCLHGGTCLAEGRGEVLTPLAPLADCWVVLVTPPVSISTVEAFRRYDEKAVPPRLEGNVFEDLLSIPVVAEIKQTLTGAGASNAMMSGSGPTVFGIFEDENRAKTAFDTLRAEFPKTFLTKPV
ncbi:MAG: 4-(cytidine 5'-diphospho)-2-C-methyl-D-erythritol kinase [Oscillospiraceae bacterium]|jgi:4-diphosphocytidyl-2-C-methyl-D-erythritol kinase|nr:4-(cytidine 5'-diphospho)-2-C-methyl-D-erythritol kinase [Oscillospiraceae bacterium]